MSFNGLSFSSAKIAPFLETTNILGDFLFPVIKIAISLWLRYSSSVPPRFHYCTSEGTSK